MTRTRTLAAAFAAAVLAGGLHAGCGGGGSGGGGGGGATSQQVGPSGGTVGSPGAGQAVVAAGALASTATITIQPGTQVVAGAYQTAGPALQFGPNGTQFATPTLVTIPVTVPAGKTIADIVVLKRDDATNVVTVLIPTSRDAVASTVTVSTSSFSTFQGATPLPSAAAVFDQALFDTSLFQ